MMGATILLVGLDHRAPLAVREKVAIKKDYPLFFTRLFSLPRVREAVLLSTCHRTEVYVVLEGEPYRGEEIFCALFPHQDGVYRGYLYEFLYTQAVHHLFRVACGLESVVLGEEQILGQVKEAWRKAQELHATGKYLNELFRRAVTLGKKFREVTGITRYPTSLSSLAVRMLKQVLGDLSGKRAVVIGSGEMGQLSIRHLLREGVSEVAVICRNPERAQVLRERFPPAVLVPPQEKYRYLTCGDIVISATDAPHYAVEREKFLAFYKGNPVVFVDLAVPRDIDPRLGEIAGITLFNIDDLQGAIEESERHREEVARSGVHMVEEATENFLLWYGLVPLVPFVEHLGPLIEEVWREEMQYLEGRFSQQERELLGEALGRVKRKITSRCAVFLRSMVQSGYEAVCEDRNARE